jgi:hypothetical protein
MSIVGLYNLFLFIKSKKNQEESIFIYSCLPKARLAGFHDPAPAPAPTSWKLRVGGSLSTFGTDGKAGYNTSDKASLNISSRSGKKTKKKKKQRMDSHLYWPLEIFSKVYNAQKIHL